MHAFEAHKYALSHQALLSVHCRYMDAAVNIHNGYHYRQHEVIYNIRVQNKEIYL